MVKSQPQKYSKNFEKMANKVKDTTSTREMRPGDPEGKLCEQTPSFWSNLGYTFGWFYCRAYLVNLK